MLFLDKQDAESKKRYFQLLKIVGSLSNLFSDSSMPYLYYRVAENIFCKAFDADNLSRSDVSVDARKGNDGIGVKTFLENNGKTFQKIAEFDKGREEFHEFLKAPDKLIRHIAELRNKRIEFTRALHGLDDMFYHCITRDVKKYLVYEIEMKKILIDKIRRVTSDRNTISFNDTINEYKFSLSKSTLYKRFYTRRPIGLDIHVLEDPYPVLERLYKEATALFDVITQEKPNITLPLYSKERGNMYVPEKSGLNQWNAGGRKRKSEEVYIPIPIWINKLFNGFFPNRDTCFNLKLPDNKMLSAKICQGASKKHPEWGKGFMSNPNTDLGNWLLRHVLKLPEGKLATYDLLNEIGVDSVEITKINNENYEINFKKIGSFEEFENEYYLG